MCIPAHTVAGAPPLDSCPLHLTPCAFLPNLGPGNPGGGGGLHAESPLELVVNSTFFVIAAFSFNIANNLFAQNAL